MIGPLDIRLHALPHTPRPLLLGNASGTGPLFPLAIVLHFLVAHIGVMDSLALIADGDYVRTPVQIERIVKLSCPMGR